MKLLTKALMSVVAAGIFSLLSSSAFAQKETTLFGEITIGKPLSIPQCKKSYESEDIMCFVKLSDPGTVSLSFATNESPDYMRFPPSIFISNNVVIGINFVTNGVIGQSDVFQSLVKKFGQPNSKAIGKVSTVAGVSHDSINAEWQTPELKVLFSGVTKASVYGLVIIGNPEGIKVMTKSNPQREM